MELTKSERYFITEWLRKHFSFDADNMNRFVDKTLSLYEQHIIFEEKLDAAKDNLFRFGKENLSASKQKELKKLLEVICELYEEEQV